MYDANGGAEIGLYHHSTGDPDDNEPMAGEVAWFPYFDPKTFQTTKPKEKEALQKRFLANAWKYLSTDDRREERIMEKDFNWPHDTRWFKFFEAAKLYKRRKRQARASTAIAGAGAAAAEQEEEVLSEDSGFVSNIVQSSKTRAGTEMGPPPPPNSSKKPSAHNSGTVRSNNTSGKCKLDTQPKRRKISKANSTDQRRQEDEVAQSYNAEDSFSRNTPRQNSLTLMSGALGSSDEHNSQLFTGNPSSGIHNQPPNNFATADAEDTEYEDDYVLSPHPSENPRNRSVSWNHRSTRFSSPREAGQESEDSRPPNHFRPFSIWGGGEGAAASSIGLRPMSQPRSEPAISGYVSPNSFVNKRAATEVDYEGYNMGLSNKDAFDRACSESAALEPRTSPTTGNWNGMSNNNDRIPKGVQRSIEVEDEEDI